MTDIDMLGPAFVPLLTLAGIVWAAVEAFTRLKGMPGWVVSNKPFLALALSVVGSMAMMASGRLPLDSTRWGDWVWAAFLGVLVGMSIQLFHDKAVKPMGAALVKKSDSQCFHDKAVKPMGAALVKKSDSQ